MIGKTTLARHYDQLSLWGRVRLKVSGHQRRDEVEAQRLDDMAPDDGSPAPPHVLAALALNTFALMYVGEQLEHVGGHFFAMMKLRDGDVTDEGRMVDLAALACVNAYCFEAKARGWERFCARIGVDPDALVAGNHHGAMLGLCAKQMGKFSPEEREILDWFGSKGLEPGPLITPESEYESWRGLLEAGDAGPAVSRRGEGRMTKDVSKQYGLLKPIERFRLVFAAGDRGDDAELQRLKARGGS